MIHKKLGWGGQCVCVCVFLMVSQRALVIWQHEKWHQTLTSCSDAQTARVMRWMWSGQGCSRHRTTQSQVVTTQKIHEGLQIFCWTSHSKGEAVDITILSVPRPHDLHVPSDRLAMLTGAAFHGHGRVTYYLNGDSSYVPAATPVLNHQKRATINCGDSQLWQRSPLVTINSSNHKTWRPSDFDNSSRPSVWSRHFDRIH